MKKAGFQVFSANLQDSTIFTPAELSLFLETACCGIQTVDKRLKGGTIQYFNVPAAFDIETSSFYDDAGEPKATMYLWQFGLNGCCMVGRTWDEFSTVIDALCARLSLSESLRLFVGVHNLGFEFQWIRNRFTWLDVFALEERRPITATTTTGIEFHCTYLLSGLSLAKVGENLTKYPVSKMVGDLDYAQVRHSATPITEKEMGYAVNDIKVVMAFMQEKIETDGNITKIPRTNTGYVRKFCRAKCFSDRAAYYRIIHNMNLTPGDYQQMKRAFQGGFTHANPFYSGEVQEEVSSIDFTSSYPAMICSKRFPMSSPEPIEIKGKADFEHNISLYACVFDVEFVGLESKILFDSYLSISRCWAIENPTTNNGRIVRADVLKTTLTEIDFIIVKQFYSWEKMRVSNFKRMKKGYLPKKFVEAVLELYAAKTELKGVKGKEDEYLRLKSMVNAFYGMTVTDPVRPTITYTTEWGQVAPDLEKAIDDYNNDKNRFLFYPWGVWVTAYARQALVTGMLEFGCHGIAPNTDYIYADTDSIKGLNFTHHLPYINRYNAAIKADLVRMCKFFNIPIEKTEPKTIKGEPKPLGAWTVENIPGKPFAYYKFKTLGAKRYMVVDDAGLNITVSGLNKKTTVPYLMRAYGESVFEAFSEDLRIPADFTGKKTHRYIDAETAGAVTDYLGQTAIYHELSSVHLENAEYDLSIAQEYANYLLSIKEF